MGHDQAADQARADAPTGLPDVIELAFLALELHVEGFAEILAQVVTGAGLQRHAVLHHRFHGERFQGAREFLGLGFYAFDHGHRHHVFGDLGIDIENAQHLLHRFFVRRVRGVAFLPEKLRGAEKHARAQFPADHVGPLVIEQRQVAIALNPFREKMADDGFGRRADDVGLFQFLAAGDGDDGELGRKSFDVLGFLFQKTLRGSAEADKCSDGRWL